MRESRSDATSPAITIEVFRDLGLAFAAVLVLIYVRCHSPSHFIA